MEIRRTLPPTATSIDFRDMLHGLVGIFGGKKYLEKVEAEIKQYFGVKHVFLVSSGKAALTLILLALKSLSSRQRVLIPAYTCFSVPSAVVKAGLDISLCDVDPTTLDFDLDLLTTTLDERTLCVVPTHLLGLPSDVDRVKALCRAKGVFVVEDAAQAMGGKYKGELLGTLGDVALFSLGRGKNITCGSGGIIITNSDQIAQALRNQHAKLGIAKPLKLLRTLLEVLAMHLFVDPRVYWFPAALPFLKIGETKFFDDFPIHRLDGLRAGLLFHWQERLEQSNNARCTAARELMDHLSARIEVIRSPFSEKTIYLRLPIMVESKQMKERLCILSDESGLGMSPLYPTAIQSIKELRHKLESKEYPAAAMVAERLVTLPVHHLVWRKDLEQICHAMDSLHTVAYEDVLCSTMLGK